MRFRAALSSSERRGVRRSAIRTVRRVMVRCVRVVGLACLLVLLGAMFCEERLIFFPVRYPDGDWDAPGIGREDVYFRTADGVRLHGWFCEVPDADFVVLFSHGNAGNLTHRDGSIRFWQRQVHASVFIYDYRGYGRSEGSPNERGVYADARAAYAWLRDEKRIAPERIVLFGESIGAAVSVQLGVEVPHRALVLESAFTSAVAMGVRQYPWLPVRWMMRNRFDSLAKIGRHRGPVFVAHGTQDSIVPFEMGRTVYEHANEPKRLYAVEGADHNDLPWVGGESYYRAIRGFLEGTRAE